MKTGKKLTAVVLMLVMMFSLLPVAQVNATTTEETQGPLAENEIAVSIMIDAPYKAYFNTYGAPYSYCFDVINTDEALRDDFGIGLSNDGTPDVEEDGKGYVSALRVLAYFIREDIKKRYEDTWFTPEDKTDEAYPKKLNEKANSEMGKYIKIAESSYGGYNVAGLSDDGVNWDQGLASAGESPYTGSWMAYVNAEEGQVSHSLIPVKTNSFVEFCILPYGADTGDLIMDIKDSMDYYPIVGQELKIQVLKGTYDESWQLVWNPAPGVKFRLYNAEGVPADIILETDADGYLTYTPTTYGEFILVGCEEYDDGQGNIYSKTEAASGIFHALAKPPKAKSVKTTVTGKKKAKKKNIKVSFKLNDPLFNKNNTGFYVYLSKKKNTGYKKVVTVKKKKLNATIKNKKKGTYYIKIQSFTHYDIPYSKDEVKKIELKSGFTTPKKVVVK